MKVVKWVLHSNIAAFFVGVFWTLHRYPAGNALVDAYKELAWAGIWWIIFVSGSIYIANATWPTAALLSSNFVTRIKPRIGSAVREVLWWFAFSVGAVVAVVLLSDYSTDDAARKICAALLIFGMPTMLFVIVLQSWFGTPPTTDREIPVNLFFSAVLIFWCGIGAVVFLSQSYKALLGIAITLCLRKIK